MAFLWCRREWEAICEGRTEGVDMEMNRRIFKVGKTQGNNIFDLKDLPKDVQEKCLEADLTIEETLAVILYSGAALVLTLHQSFPLVCVS